MKYLVYILYLGLSLSYSRVLQQQEQNKNMDLSTLQMYMPNKTVEVNIAAKEEITDVIGKPNTYFLHYEAVQTSEFAQILCRPQYPDISFEIISQFSISERVQHNERTSFVFDYLTAGNYLYMIAKQDTIYFCKLNFDQQMEKGQVCSDIQSKSLGIPGLVNTLFDSLYVEDYNIILLVSSTSQLTFVDVTQRDNPQKINTIDLNKLLNKTVIIKDNMIYKNHYFLSLGGQGAYVLDITDRNNVSVKHVFNPDFFGLAQVFIYTITYEGNLIFMVDKFSNKLFVIDSFDVAQPKIVSTIIIEESILKLEIQNHALVILTKAKVANKYNIEEYIEDWQNPGNFIRNRGYRIFSPSISLVMNTNYAFIAYENFIGVYKHSVPNKFSPQTTSLYSSFLAEGILDASLFQYTSGQVKQDYVIIVAGVEMIFVKFYSKLPGYTCSTMDMEQIEPGSYQYNIMLFDNNCQYKQYNNVSNVTFDNTYVQCITQGTINVTVYQSIFESQQQALIIGFSLGFVIICIACVCFGVKVRKLKYKQLSQNEQNPSVEDRGNNSDRRVEGLEEKDFELARKE